jgi:SAM-dependent methyltransferase
MSTDYSKVERLLIERLSVAHSKKAPIRVKFFEKEFAFFKKHIRGKNVFVAGSGLGHDAIKLAQYNNNVVGVEILPNLVNYSNKKKLPNTTFICSDFLKNDFGKFDVSILNMGTIGNFDDKENVINSLLEKASKVYLDFYIPTCFEERKQMYEEEGWKNVIEKNGVLSNFEGLESKSVTRKEMEKIILNIGATARFYRLNEFTMMVEIEKKNNFVSK